MKQRNRQRCSMPGCTNPNKFTLPSGAHLCRACKRAWRAEQALGFGPQLPPTVKENPRDNTTP